MSPIPPIGRIPGQRNVSRSNSKIPVGTALAVARSPVINTLFGRPQGSPLRQVSIPVSVRRGLAPTAQKRCTHKMNESLGLPNGSPRQFFCILTRSQRLFACAYAGSRYIEVNCCPENAPESLSNSQSKIRRKMDTSTHSVSIYLNTPISIIRVCTCTYRNLNVFGWCNLKSISRG